MKTKATILSILAICLLLPACQTLQQIANLRLVDFDMDRVSGARLAGVNIDRFQNYNDLSAADLLRLGSVLASGDLPLEFTLHLNAENPESNSVDAQMVRMDWTLFLEDKETVSGVFDERILLPPGVVTDVPIFIRLDLVDFFDENLANLVDLALAVSGQGGESQNVKIRVQPTIDTPLGPIRYPQPITIISQDVGANASR
jgi:hypothetical protein